MRSGYIHWLHPARPDGDETTNTSTRSYDETTLAHINTIGRDFDAYGGDIPFAIACAFTCAQRKSKKYQKMVAVYMSKILSSKDVGLRLRHAAAASAALHEFIGHDDWLFDTLTAYYSEPHGKKVAKRMAMSAFVNVDKLLEECNDDPMKLTKALVAIAWQRLTGKYPVEALAA